MKKHRILYFLLLLLIIFLGIMSRKTTFVPLWTGDYLYAIMIFILIRIILINKKPTQILLLSLITCYAIELLQLYQANWIIEVRKTLFGRYVLGQGLWSDIAAYTFGLVTAFIIEKIFLNHYNYETRFRIKQQK